MCDYVVLGIISVQLVLVNQAAASILVVTVEAVFVRVPAHSDGLMTDSDIDYGQHAISTSKI